MEKMLWQGEKLFIQGRIEEAQEVFRELLEQNPGHPDILNNIGVIHCSNKAFDQAETCFVRALETNGNHFNALNNLSKVYEAREEWEKAAAYLEQYMRLKGNDSELQKRLSGIYAHLKEGAETPDWLNTVLNPAPPGTAVIRGISGPGRPDDPSPQEPPHKNPAVSPRTNTRPMVSIGLPVYNGEELLRESIESLLSQDFKDFELIISDNGSMDSTPDICAEYAKMDQRITYHRMEDNIGAIRNFTRTLNSADSPFFMWASHDDLHQTGFISRCLDRITRDPSIALVYAATEMVDKNNKSQGVVRDSFQVDQEEPVERFRRLIWNLGLCNMFYGLYRTRALRKATSLRRNLYRAYDNLLLAEIALSGKIVQLDEALFIRRTTRNRNLTLEELNANLINTFDSYKMTEGITFPHCRLAYAHFELIHESDLSDSEKNYLLGEIRDCFKTRFGYRMLTEIDRALNLINQGTYFYTWDKKSSGFAHTDSLHALNNYRINNLIKVLQEAAFIYPELHQIQEALTLCLQAMRHDTHMGEKQQELPVN